MAIDKQELKTSIENYLMTLFRKEPAEATKQQMFQSVCYAMKEYIINDWVASHKAVEQKEAKTVYYMSMEFLMGRALGNILINMKADKVVSEVLNEYGLDLDTIEDEEPDAALGNGGLGRLAACFLDSLATLGYSAVGCGIRYKYGMFKQQIENGFQIEVPDTWLKNGNPFEMKEPECAKLIKFGGYVRMTKNAEGRECFVQEDCQTVMAVPYELPIVGYNNHFVDTLRIWDAEAVNDFQLDQFDKGDYHKAVEQENLAKTICEVLYPNDNHYAGKELRLKQQYFFVSASVQLAVSKFMDHYHDLRRLPEKVVFQMNDTHPSVTVAELMRVLMDDYYLSWDEAWELTRKSCAYTNHTIMAEALEKWPLELFSRLLPRIYQIVEEINRRFIHEIQITYPGDYHMIEKMAIVYDGQVRMANLAIVGGFSVNGVARLHTEILKTQSLKEFAQYFPDKFNNKTNGITQRRFLLHGNPLLAEWVSEKIGEDWITNLSRIEKLALYADDEKAQHEFMNIKYRNKLRLAAYIKEHNGVDVDPRSIFDVQVKRMPE